MACDFLKTYTTKPRLEPIGLDWTKGLVPICTELVATVTRAVHP